MHITGIGNIKKYTVTPQQLELMRAGEIVDLGSPNFETTENNIINKRLILDLVDGNIIWTNTRRIAVSSQNTTEDYEAQTLTLCHAVGDETLVPSNYVFTDRTDVTPAEIVYSGRFLPPAATRTINTIAMTTTSASFVDNPGGTTLDTYTQLKLGTTLNQADNEVLDISYKIFISWIGNSLNAPEAYQRAVEWQFFGRNGARTGIVTRQENNIITWNPGRYSAQPFKFAHLSSTSNPRGLGYIATGALPLPTEDAPPFGATNQIWYPDVEYGRAYYHFGRTSGDDALTNNCLGYPVRAILFGSGRDDFDFEYYTTEGGNTVGTGWEVYNAGAPDYIHDWIAEYKFTKTSNLSNVFSHNDVATSPMYEVTSLANSSLKPVFTENTEVRDFMTAYYLKVTFAGGIGVGQYKPYIDNFNNYQNNDLNSELVDFSWVWHLASESPWTVDPTDEGVLWDARWIYAWEKAQNSYKYVSYHRDAGLALWELNDLGNNPLVEIGLSDTAWISAGLLVDSRIHDVAVYQPGDVVYVATSSGLYEITTFSTSPSFNQLTADETWAVCVGLGGAVFAAIEDSGDPNGGRLSSSTGANWNTDISGTAAINWSNIWAINIDPESATYDILIHEGPHPQDTPTFYTAAATGLIKGHWWDNTAGGTLIQTDLFDTATVGSPVATTDYIFYDQWYFSNSHTVQVTKGVWIYPGNAYYMGARVINEGLSNFSFQPLNLDFNAPGNQQYPINLLYEHQRDLAEQGYFYDPSFRHTNETSTIGTSLYKMGCSKDYHFGKHAAAPFHTEIFDGSTGELVVGKQNAVDTVYSLCFYVGSNHGIGQGATSASQTGRFIYQKFKLNVDEGGTSTLVDYGQQNSRYLDSQDDSRLNDYKNTARGQHLFHFVTVYNKRVYWFKNPHERGYNDPQSAAGYRPSFPDPANKYFDKQTYGYHDGGIGPYNALRVPEELGPSDFDDIWLDTYSWNGSSWDYDLLNTGVGRPAHSGVATFFDGLDLQWTELQPGNPQPLIENQWYNIVKITDPHTILSETTSPLIEGRCDFYYRELTTATDSGTIPGGLTVIVPEAPTGSAPDPDWLSMFPDLAGQNVTATIAGSEVLVEVNTGGNPPAGTIYITNPETGEITFNVADVGQAYVFNYVWIHKYDSSEIL